MDQLAQTALSIASELSSIENREHKRKADAQRNFQHAIECLLKELWLGTAIHPEYEVGIPRRSNWYSETYHSSERLCGLVESGWRLMMIVSLLSSDTVMRRRLMPTQKVVHQTNGFRNMCQKDVSLTPSGAPCVIDCKQFNAH